MIPIVVVKVILDMDIPSEDQVRLLRQAIERQESINRRRTVIELPDEGWSDTGSSAGYDPRD